jgi:hypothetical protein
MTTASQLYAIKLEQKRYNSFVLERKSFKTKTELEVSECRHNTI